ncbi:uncharacterized protein VDAG_03855 [Verticillium dahliae VdLs.17]|uniref:Uncharacterized protein n=1 Tax=Verticillium dahliae (strain VdLs.17 / ATCC MYA-4575 / FGSC 10137) TaxID=498257 RepID=G2X0S6_VERDV|nr:uncharacterized protein VDAG_03855 [Verticillium dahliae VdLs.17]EGY22417.1 hypothetical protein VDAG_03855 [Verticillium dahliae VdLs.17]
MPRLVSVRLPLIHLYIDGLDHNVYRPPMRTGSAPRALAGQTSAGKRRPAHGLV